MKIRALSIEGAYEITPVVLGDPRGNFAELYKEGVFVAAVGHRLRVAQINTSTSARDVVRGVHWTDVPPGQAKYVTCQRGAMADFIVDLREGSPTFGQWESVVLDAAEKKAVFIREGLGHGFRALADDTSVHYLCSTPYDPRREYVIHPLDPELNIDWGVTDPMLSARDGNAPSLAAVRADGRLPDYRACLDVRASPRD